MIIIDEESRYYYWNNLGPKTIHLVIHDLQRVCLVPHAELDMELFCGP
jgi:hypothetical protein